MVIQGGIPMFGSIAAQIQSVQPVSIHDDIYYDLTLRILTDEQLETQNQNSLNIREPAYQVRVPNHLCPNRTPKSGDLLEITFIAQQPTELIFIT